MRICFDLLGSAYISTEPISLKTWAYNLLRMEKKKSKKHHYLPRKYLRGFTNSKGSFFVYDKLADKIHPTSPDDAFFENNLNTVKFSDGSTSDFLEDSYTDFENRSWSSLDKFINSTPKTSFSKLDLARPYLFILNLHWRLPANIHYVESLSKEFLQGENNFDYLKVRSKTGGIVPVDVIKRIKDSLAFNKSTKLAIPLAPFIKDKNWSRNLENWRFVYSGDKEVWFMVGDKPIITRGDSDQDPINCLKEFVFPVSGKVILVNSQTHNSKMLPPQFTLQFNLAIMERAQRFVACQRKDLLDGVISLYKMRVQYDRTDDIITELFDAIKTGE
jgi:Protein of unknown function (DUF4238)